MVPQEVVQLDDATLVILAVGLVLHVDIFACVQMMQPQVKCLSERGLCGGGFGDGRYRNLFRSTDSARACGDSNCGEGGKGNGKGAADAGRKVQAKWLRVRDWVKRRA
jgi:hypothetical protein